MFSCTVGLAFININPQNNVTARDKFKYQLQLIKEASTVKCLILGDFNLDYSRVSDVHYVNKYLFEDFDSILYRLELIQVVNFVTWTRLVGHNLRSSILDHIYIKDPTVIRNLRTVTPFFGDHLLVLFDVQSEYVSVTNLNRKRDWRFYSKEILNVNI